MDQKQKAIIVSSIIIVAVAFGFTANFGSTSNQVVGYIVPLYANPNTATGQAVFNALIQQKQANPGVPMIAIINPYTGPGTGPGTSTDPNSEYAPYTADLQAVGIIVIGYVWTNYGAIAQSTVETQMSNYKTWYNVNGIDLDSMSNVAGLQSYYSTLTAYGHSNGMPEIVGVSGSTMPSSYVGTVDVIIPYATTGLPLASTVAADTTGTGGVASQWGIIAEGVSTAPTPSYISSVASNIAWLYVTDNPFGTAPSYQSTEVSNLAIAGGVATTISTSSITTTITTGTGTSIITTPITTSTSTTSITYIAPSNWVAQYTDGIFTSGVMFGIFILIILAVIGLAIYALKKD